MLTETAIREQLRHAYDPELKLNVVDLGALHRVAVEVAHDAPGYGIAGVDPRYRVSLELLQTSAEEIAQTQLRAAIENLLLGLPEVYRVEISFVSEPAWSPALLSPEAREQLRRTQAVGDPQLPILNNRLR